MFESDWRVYLDSRNIWSRLKEDIIIALIHCRRARSLLEFVVSEDDWLGLALRKSQQSGPCTDQRMTQHSHLRSVRRQEKESQKPTLIQLLPARLTVYKDPAL